MTNNPTASPGVWCMLGETGTVDVLARAGFGWLCLDAQHGAFDRRGVIEALQRRGAGWPPVFVRPPSNDAAFIGAALDAGADGIIVPLVNSAAEARAAVAATRYPPLGRRSWGQLAPLWGVDVQTAPDANAHVQLWVMIETAEGLAAAADIAAVEGVDGVFIGPFDLSLALGTTPAELLADGASDGILPTLLATCRAAGVTVGAFGGEPGRGRRLAELGFEHVVVATDDAVLVAGAAAVLAASSA
jgi:4-hydroxy-2-oxoheptanedioate aldolase